MPAALKALPFPSSKQIQTTQTGFRTNAIAFRCNEGCVAKTGAADGRVTDVSAQPHLHAQIQPVQVASLPSFHHLIMCALVSELPTVLPTSSRDGE